jgi:hypothetical protein
MMRLRARDPLQRLVDVLAIAAGALCVATLVAERVWRQVKPS